MITDHDGASVRYEVRNSHWIAVLPKSLRHPRPTLGFQLVGVAGICAPHCFHASASEETYFHNNKIEVGPAKDFYEICERLVHFCRGSKMQLTNWSLELVGCD